MYTRVQQIRKDLVAVHDGEIVYLETNPTCKHTRYNGLAKITGLYRGDCDLYRIVWDGFGAHDTLPMTSYGKQWRLWTVPMTEPTVYERNTAPWQTVGKERRV